MAKPSCADATPGVDPGDTIATIDGVPADRWFEVELARTSAGSEGYRYVLASDFIEPLRGPTEFGLIASNGTARSVVVQPQPLSARRAFGGAPSVRTAGPLGDLGGPTLYYINLDGDVLSDMNAFLSALSAASTHTGLILDMRGYPGIDHYAVARHVNPLQFTSPRWLQFRWDGPDTRVPFEEQVALRPDQNTAFFAGPIALLVGHHTVSAAETLRSCWSMQAV